MAVRQTKRRAANSKAIDLLAASEADFSGAKPAERYIKHLKLYKILSRPPNVFENRVSIKFLTMTFCKKF